VSGVILGFTVIIRNKRIKIIRNTAVEVPSEKALSLNTQMSEIIGRQRDRNLGIKIDH
jgi:hypothetical protein